MIPEYRKIWEESNLKLSDKTTMDLGEEGLIVKYKPQHRVERFPLSRELTLQIEKPRTEAFLFEVISDIALFLGASRRSEVQERVCPWLLQVPLPWVPR